MRKPFRSSSFTMRETGREREREGEGERERERVCVVVLLYIKSLG